jgi:anti-sigma B factor antagonist
MTGLEYPIEMVNGVPVVAAPAEIDASNTGWLDAVLLDAAARSRAAFVVDMTRTQFCDSSGVGVLVQAHKRAVADGGELRLVRPASAMVLRKFAVVGIDRVIPSFPSLYESWNRYQAPPPGRRGRGAAPSPG